MYNRKQDILLKIETQIRLKTAMKSSSRKKIKRTLERVVRRFLFRFFSESNIKQYRGESNFGSDEVGRDVESGIYEYAELLKRRNLEVHTILVLGSRVKGRWTPESDVDLTIISSNLPTKGNNLISRRLYSLQLNFLFSDRPLFMGIEPSVCYTKEEYMKHLEEFDIEVLDAVVYGHVIFDDGFWQKVREKYVELVKEYNLNEIVLKEILNEV